MSKHTDTLKYPLRVGLAGSVVCDDPGLGVPDADADAYYGGRVFCETITPSNAELVVKSLNALAGIADPAAFVEAFEEMRRALQRVAKIVPATVTVRQIIEAGDDVIKAVGINPWCINEGQASGDEPVDVDFISDALANAAKVKP